MHCCSKNLKLIINCSKSYTYKLITKSLRRVKITVIFEVPFDIFTKLYIFVVFAKVRIEIEWRSILCDSAMAVSDVAFVFKNNHNYS